MSLREAVALFLVLLTACSGTPRGVQPGIDPYEAELEAARYEFHVLTADTSPAEPVEVSREDFQSAMRALAPSMPLTERPMETAQWLMEGALQADLLAVAVAEGRTFTLTVRSPGSHVAAAAEEAAEARAGIITIIRHLGGNRQVFFNGQRWHVPAGRSIKEIPLKDPVGDQLQAAAQRIARSWSRGKLSDKQLAAMDAARAQGKYLEAHLMERRFRGQWMEDRLREQFRHLKWNRTGVDVVDPSTGLRYEVLAGTESNMALHGRRMAEEFFRLITF